MQIFHATSEQMDFLQQLRDFEDKVSHPKQFLETPELLSYAKALVSRAHELEMPLSAYNNIRILLNLYDTEMAMPEHLRWFKCGV